MSAKSDAAATVFAETSYKQAARAAESFGSLALKLEASGPWLKLATVSADASDLVAQYRITLNAAATHSAIFLEVAQRQQSLIVDLLATGKVEKEVVAAIALELKRSNAFLLEASQVAQRTAKLSNMAPPAMTQEAENILHAFALRMGDLDPASPVRQAFATLIARIRPDDYGWAALAELSKQRSQAFKDRFPGVTRTTYQSNGAARNFVDRWYTNHGKGEMFEHAARNSPELAKAADDELRAAALRTAQRGLEWQPFQSVGELRLGTMTASGVIGDWKKFADNGIGIVADRAPAAAASAAAAATGHTPIHGVAEVTALFEYKAEKGVSRLGAQQERALPRMINRWARGEPVYVQMNLIDNAGAIQTKTYLLKPPDAKAGLSYYGAGTSQAFIETRDALIATQGASVRNLNLDLSNEHLREIWLELFWMAFDAP